MFRYIIQRIVALIVTLFVIVTLSFFVIRLMPGSFITDPKINPEVKKSLEAKYHLNEPMLAQYGYFIKDFAHLDFGISMAVKPNTPVNDVILSKIPATLRINIYSLIITLPLGIGLGIVAALKKNKVTDHVISTGVVLLMSVPSFVFASILQYFFAFKLGWFPILASGDSGMNWNKFLSLVLPTLAMSFGSIAGFTRFMRAELSEALTSDYMLLAKSKGLTQVQATFRHAFRNSVIPIVGGIIGMFLGLLSGSMIIERIFSIPGMGMANLEAINAKDHTLTIGILFWYSLIGLGGVILADVSLGLVDPRIRMGGRK